MNRLTVPSILAATVLIAGIFALMPVERASTVHTGLGGKIDDVKADVMNVQTAVNAIINGSAVLRIAQHTDSDQDQGDKYTLDCTEDYTDRISCKYDGS